MKITFWNLKNNTKTVDLIDAYDFQSAKSILAVAEFWDIETRILSSRHSRLFWSDGVHKRTGVFSTSYAAVSPVQSSKYYSCFEFPYNSSPVYLYVVHLKAMNDSEAAALSLNRNTVRMIAEEINNKGRDRAIIIGDFNTDGWQEMFYDHFALNATNYLKNGARPHRTFQGEKRLKFYSPILSFAGDLSEGPPGTYFYSRNHQAQDWFIFDNVFVSYPLAPFVDKGKCGILSEFAGVSLVRDGQALSTGLSAHLPITISLV